MISLNAIAPESWSGLRSIRNGRWRLGKLFAVSFWIVLALGIGSCTIPQMPPDLAPGQYIFNTMEYKWEDTVAQRVGDAPFGDVEIAGQYAFGYAAGIIFEWNFFGTIDNPGWPQPDQNDPNYDPNWAQFYADYSKANRDVGQGAPEAFGTFYVSGPPTANYCSQTHPLATTLQALPPNFNQVLDPNLRATFVFLTDVDKYYNQCISDPLVTEQNLLNHVVVHELGHQRAGLTHTDEHPIFHTGSLPSPRSDVMTSHLIMTELHYHIPMFDQKAAPPVNDNLTCADNLYSWRTIQN